jgi:hypothetical protein
MKTGFLRALIAVCVYVGISAGYKNEAFAATIYVDASVTEDGNPVTNDTVVIQALTPTGNPIGNPISPVTGANGKIPLSQLSVPVDNPSGLGVSFTEQKYGWTGTRRVVALYLPDGNGIWYSSVSFAGYICILKTCPPPPTP